MNIEFEQDYLRALYEEGKASGKKHRFQPQIIRQYQKTINRLRDADKIEDLFLIASLNYEKLGSDKKGIESVRVNDQYRIEFKSRTERKEPETITICSIIELSNHYK
ncbi:type II toxin-antitoxin system RelE/ParE family toxin [Candidatus Nomurabacteria bacterium]|nr:type II toxin-antitoxin system RelE/ParE family toxin [Candidatus Nomurabacteria bacterium]